jgi:hypothetical protein
VIVLLVVATVGARAQPAAGGDDDGRGHEAWAIDQSETTPDGGGTQYIHRDGTLAGRSPASRPTEAIDPAVRRTAFVCRDWNRTTRRHRP